MATAQHGATARPLAILPLRSEGHGERPSPGTI
jgi:hypothetical protein